MRERKLIRLSGFDYSVSRYYFITICVKNHVQSFGSVENNTMRLSKNGIIAHEQWIWLEDQYPYIELISFVIMPDHIHCIIHIDADYYNHEKLEIDADRLNGRNNIVGNGRDRSLQSIQTNPKIKPLPELIGAYKTTVSKRIHLHWDVLFKWQKSYYDHIIRNIRSLNRIKEYIRANPEKWGK